MDIDTARLMLGLLLGKHWSLFPSFHQYLEVHTFYFLNITYFNGLSLTCNSGGYQWHEEKLLHGICSYFCISFQQSKYKVINKDQWCNVLEFSRLIQPDLSNYDEDGACK